MKKFKLILGDSYNSHELIAEKFDYDAEQIIFTIGDKEVGRFLRSKVTGIIGVSNITPWVADALEKMGEMDTNAVMAALKVYSVKTNSELGALKAGLTD